MPLSNFPFVTGEILIHQEYTPLQVLYMEHLQQGSICMLCVACAQTDLYLNGRLNPSRSPAHEIIRSSFLIGGCTCFYVHVLEDLSVIIL